MTHASQCRDDDSASPTDSRLTVEAHIVQAHLAGMLALTPHAVIGTDPQQQITLVNPGAEELFGYPREELLDLPLAVLLPSLVDAATGVGTLASGPHRTIGVRKGGATFAATAEIARVEVADGAVCTIQIREPHPLDAPVAGAMAQALRETEAALQDTERKLGTLFDLLPVGISILDAERTLVYANPALDQILRLDRSNVSHHAYQQRQYLRPDGTPLAPEEFASARAFRERQPVTDVETGIVTETGEVIWTSVSAAPVDFPDWRVVVVTTDITARKRAEAQQAYKGELLANVHDAIVGTDATLHVSYWNHAAEALFGWTAQEARGQATAALFQTEIPQASREAAVTQLMQAGHDDGEAIYRRKDGSTIHAHVKSVVLRDAQGAFTGLVTSIEDITARTQAEAALRRSMVRLRVLSEASRAFAEVGAEYQAVIDRVAQVTATGLNAECMLYLLSADGAWLHLAAVYDLDPEKVALTRLTVSTDPLHVDEPSFATRIFQTSQPIFFPVVDPEQMRAVSKPEYRSSVDRLNVRSIIGVPVRVQGRTIGVLVLFRHQPAQPSFDQDDLTLAQDLADRAALAIGNARLLAQVQHELTERTHAEEALEAERALLARRVAERTADLSLANAELARAARLKDEFLASMSHELRTPLTGILGRAEALQEAIYGPVTAEQVAALHSIAESGQHLLTLINDILDLSKIESGRLTLEYATLEVDLLGTMTMRMVAQIAHVKRITLTSSFDGQVQRVYADERRLKQILVNLLANAVKFTPEGGKVGLEVQGNPEQQAVTFTVWDTGIGIAAEDLPKLFQPFVQLDSSLNRQYSGTGLGLALVARLAQAHRGSVAVESTPGQGSRFSVTLPWSPTVPATTPVSATAAVDTARPAVRQALVIEDSPTAAAQITRYLRELGARVEIHPYGTGTVERAIALQPDVIILDILLPDDDGWAVLSQLKAEPRTRDIPVLVVSVVDAPEQARAQGAAAMLVKPIDRPTLEQALRQILVRPSTLSVPTAMVVSRQLERPRILLADDNEETLETIGDYLRAKGYDLRVARTGREALVQAQEERPDVILMDIQMPGMDGLEVIRRIRAEATLAHVPILAVTALAMPADRERCLAAGADAYLPKPLSLRTLVATIEAHRQRRTGAATDAAGNDDPAPDR
ncbi:MAG: response regulator [Chloroflexales bacterium]|nr:response regulator [Chloroflexales bacterium]